MENSKENKSVNSEKNIFTELRNFKMNGWIKLIKVIETELLKEKMMNTLSVFVAKS